jgi:hypothetical protein
MNPKFIFEISKARGLKPGMLLGFILEWAKATFQFIADNYLIMNLPPASAAENISSEFPFNCPQLQLGDKK